MYGAPSEIRSASGGEVEFIQTRPPPFGELRVSFGSGRQRRSSLGTTARTMEAGCAVQVSLPRSKVPPKKANPMARGLS